MYNSKLELLEKKVREIAALFNPLETTIPAFNKYPIEDTRPYIFLEDDGTYLYCKAERGQEKYRHSTKDENELLYWIFEDLTGNHCLLTLPDDGASPTEKTLRMKQRQYDLMTQIDESWGPRVKERLKL